MRMLTWKVVIVISCLVQSNLLQAGDAVVMVGEKNAAFSEELARTQNEENVRKKRIKILAVAVLTPVVIYLSYKLYLKLSAPEDPFERFAKNTAARRAELALKLKSAKGQKLSPKEHEVLKENLKVSTAKAKIQKKKEAERQVQQKILDEKALAQSLEPLTRTVLKRKNPSDPKDKSMVLDMEQVTEDVYSLKDPNDPSKGYIKTGTQKITRPKVETVFEMEADGTTLKKNPKTGKPIPLMHIRLDPFKKSKLDTMGLKTDDDSDDDSDDDDGDDAP